MFKLLKLILVSCGLFIYGPQELLAEGATEPAISAEQFLAGLKFQQGKISLPGGIATLDLPATFQYLDPTDSERILVEAWGNPPGNKTLGMIFPVGVSPLSESGWGVVITYQEEGHIKDDDADSIKYDELLGKVILARGNSAKEVFIPTLSFIYLLGKIEYTKEIDVIEYVK